jgi:ribonuclease HI
MSRLFIATDGGATGNGRAHCVASWAFVAVPEAELDSIGGQWNTYEAYGRVEGKQSNNTGELMAIIKALEFIDQEYIWISFSEIWLISDSQYSLNSIDIWSRKWKANEDRKNMDLIIRAREIIDKLRLEGIVVNLIHIRGHLAEPGPVKSPNGGQLSNYEARCIWLMNDRADKYCTLVLEGTGKAL